MITRYHFFSEDWRSHFMLLPFTYMIVMEGEWSGRMT
jgi:hypothetical protein